MGHKRRVRELVKNRPHRAGGEGLRVWKEGCRMQGRQLLPALMMEGGESKLGS